MIRRRAIAAGLVLTGVLAIGIVTAGTAGADGPGSGPATAGPGTAGCTGGGSCWAQLSSQIHLQGSPPEAANAAGGNVPGVSVASIPPPSCWMQYFNTGQGTYAWYQGYMQNGDPMVVPSLAQYGDQIKQEKDKGAGQGAWYVAVENPSAPPDGISCVEKLPQMEWVGPGGDPVPATPPIPQHDLAMYALAHMVLPHPSFDLNPQNRSYVSLPTFVTDLQGAGGPRSVTATLGNEQATVTATNAGVTFDTPASQKYYNCNTNAADGKAGTSESPAQMDKAGPGTKPDCGVVYQSPSTGYGQGYPFTANVMWTATLVQTGETLATIPMRSKPRFIPVAEIQSINNNG